MRMTLLHQRQIKVAVGRDLFRGVQVLDIVFEDGIQNVVRRQRINVLLIGTQLRRGRFLQCGLRELRRGGN